MDLLIETFNKVLYEPLFNALIFLYNVIPGHDLGIAIIVLTVAIRFLLYPLSQKAIKSQKALVELQPQIKEIQKKYKEKTDQAKATMDLYRKYKINPMSGCLPILIQLPILIALYRVFYTGLDPDRLNGLYGFVVRPEILNPMFLGIINLSERNIPLALLAGFLMFVQSKMMMSKGSSLKVQGTKTDKVDFSSIMSHQMTYFMPLITVFIAWNLPAGLPLYWVVITLFGIIQQYFTKTMKFAT
jgi:YidC/Oxa1 family membrane protein insertase